MLKLRDAIAGSAAVLAIAGAVALGNWQTQRAAAKIVLERAWIDAERKQPIVVDSPSAIAVEHLPQRVRMRGSFAHEKTVWLDNRMLDGVAGFYIVTPLILDRGPGAVIVNRGWAARDPAERTRLPAVGYPQGNVEIEGLALRELPRLLELGDRTLDHDLPAIWHNFDVDAMRPLIAAPLADFVVQQTSSIDDGLLRRWIRPAFGLEKHRGYAFQWYALAVLIGVIGVSLVVRGQIRSHSRTP